MNKMFFYISNETKVLMCKNFRLDSNILKIMIQTRFEAKVFSLKNFRLENILNYIKKDYIHFLLSDNSSWKIYLNSLVTLVI